MSRNIEDLYPPAREIARKQLELIKELLKTHSPHTNAVLGDTWRSLAAQQIAVSTGHSRASGKDSPHTLTLPDGTPAACGWDIYLTRDGKLIPDKDPLWGIIPFTAGAIAAGKVISGAHWQSIRDWPHTELANWKALLQDGTLK